MILQVCSWPLWAEKEIPARSKLKFSNEADPSDIQGLWFCPSMCLLRVQTYATSCGFVFGELSGWGTSHARALFASFCCEPFINRAKESMKQGRARPSLPNRRVSVGCSSYDICNSPLPPFCMASSSTPCKHLRRWLGNNIFMLNRRSRCGKKCSGAWLVDIGLKMKAWGPARGLLDLETSFDPRLALFGASNAWTPQKLRMYAYIYIGVCFIVWANRDLCVCQDVHKWLYVFFSWFGYCL